MKRRLALPALTLTFCAAAAAHAEGDAAGFAPAVEAGGGFGAAGQIALSIGATADEPFFFHKNGGNWTLQLAPAADYFIIQHVSVGGAVSFRHASGGVGTGANASGSDDIGIAARAGYSFGINDKFSIWPMAGLALGHSSLNHSSSTSTALTIFAPFLFHPAPHFFVGAGPSFRLGLSGGGNQIGLDSMLGGWF